MTTELVIKIANKVKEIDPRISATADGGTIIGCFRGKTSERYCYMITTRSFVYNTCSYHVQEAIEQAIEECKPVVIEPVVAAEPVVVENATTEVEPKLTEHQQQLVVEMESLLNFLDCLFPIENQPIAPDKKYYIAETFLGNSCLSIQYELIENEFGVSAPKFLQVTLAIRHKVLDVTDLFTTDELEAYIAAGSTDIKIVSVYEPIETK